MISYLPRRKLVAVLVCGGVKFCKGVEVESVERGVEVVSVTKGFTCQVLQGC